MPAKQGDRSRQGEEGEDVVDAARIGARRNEARREQRLDLGREQEHVLPGNFLARPVERANPETVARE